MASKRAESAPPAEIRSFHRGMHYDYSSMPVKKRRTTTQAPRINIQSNSQEASIQWTLENASMSEADESHPLGRRSLITYSSLLKQLGGIVPSCESYMTFAMKDFNTENETLKSHSYVDISRRPMQDKSGNFFWLYSCSCQPGVPSLVSGLSSVLDVSQSELPSILGDDCLHITVLKPILTEVDIKLDLSADPQKDEPHTELLFEVDASNTLAEVGVVADGAVAVVGVIRSALKCFTCPGTSTCVHCNLVNKHVALTLDEVNGFVPVGLLNIKDQLRPPTSSGPSSKSASVSKGVSNMPIPLLPIQDEPLGLVEAVPASGNCPKCSHFLHPDVNIFYVGMYPMITLNKVLNVKVYELICHTKDCGGKLSYDGSLYGILNMGSYLITHFVLYDYLFHFVHGRCPLYRYFLVLRDRNTRKDQLPMSAQNVVTYNNFRSAWYHFIDHVEVNIAEGFFCPDPQCQHSPQVIVCDATSLAYRHHYNKSWMSLMSVDHCQDDALQCGSSYSDRVFITDAALRRQVSKLAMATPVSPVLVEEFQQLLLSTSLLPPLHDFISLFANNRFPPPELQEFLCHLASPSSVCGWIQPSARVQKVILDIAAGRSITDRPEQMKVLQEGSPCLFNLINCVDLSQELRCIIKLLGQCALRPFIGPAPYAENAVQSSSPESFFPCLPIVRDRGYYEADKRTKHIAGSNKCRKMSSSHPSLLPGIFTVFCPHGICYGFEVMLQCESPNVPFSILQTRFLHMPKVIVYDNACNLHEYALNRNPQMFKESQFLVDRFHWDNHTACAGYNISSYPQYQNLNTQVVEQANSELRRIKSSLSYMNQRNFMKHLSLFLYFLNQRHLKRH